MYKHAEKYESKAKSSMLTNKGIKEIKLICF